MILNCLAFVVAIYKTEKEKLYLLLKVYSVSSFYIKLIVDISYNSILGSFIFFSPRKNAMAISDTQEH